MSYTGRINKTLVRTVRKSGQLNLYFTNLPSGKYVTYAKDFANTLVTIRWRWVVLTVVLCNFIFYLFFAALWMLDAWLSGDFVNNGTTPRCIEATDHFSGYLLLSIETITTTGYGYLYPSEQCTLAFVIMTLITMVMILIDGAFISVVFLKLCKPLRKDAMDMFSKRAVICLRDGKLCLIIRLNDNSNKHTISPSVSLFLLATTQINEKISDKFDQIREIRVRPIGMIFWPTDIVHVIDIDSPFYNLSAHDLMMNRFEIIATATGTSMTTNQFSVTQTSYVSNDIRWGYRFKTPMKFNEKKRKHDIFEDWSGIIPCDTPLCSASTIDEIRGEFVE